MLSEEKNITWIFDLHYNYVPSFCVTSFMDVAPNKVSMSSSKHCIHFFPYHIQRNFFAKKPYRAILSIFPPTHKQLFFLLLWWQTFGEKQTKLNFGFFATFLEIFLRGPRGEEGRVNGTWLHRARTRWLFSGPWARDLKLVR